MHFCNARNKPSRKACMIGARVTVGLVVVTLVIHTTRLWATFDRIMHPPEPPPLFLREKIYNTDELWPVNSSARVTSLLKPLDNFVVPNIVHYIWIGEYEPLKFHQFLSIKSVDKFMEPERILFHCDHEPTGAWWKYARDTIAKLRVVHFDPPTDIFGNTIVKPEHQSDVGRIQILKEEGGIYVDTDVLVLKSFDALRHYNFTMGLEYHGNPGRLNNGVIVAEKNAKFLDIWLRTYVNFTKREWDEHDSIVPYWLQYSHPHLIHVEEKTLNYPSGKQLDLIYDKLYDWHGNYAIHLWHRLHELQHGPNDIKRMNTTFGEVARYIYYGTPKLKLEHYE